MADARMLTKDEIAAEIAAHGTDELWTRDQIARAEAQDHAALGAPVRRPIQLGSNLPIFESLNDRIDREERERRAAQWTIAVCTGAVTALLLAGLTLIWVASAT